MRQLSTVPLETRTIDDILGQNRAVMAPFHAATREKQDAFNSAGMRVSGHLEQLEQANAAVKDAEASRNAALNDAFEKNLSLSDAVEGPNRAIAEARALVEAIQVALKVARSERDEAQRQLLEVRNVEIFMSRTNPEEIGCAAR